MRLVANYDALRLSLYKKKGPRGSVIAIGALPAATLLRFDDVNYFNRVYARNTAVDGLASMEEFFRGSPHGCRLIAPVGSANRSFALACESRGWRRAEEQAWLAAAPAPASPALGDDGVEVRPPHPHEQVMFLRTYLTGFGADPARHAMAIENMRHLFSVPDLHFRIAFCDGAPAGIGMLYRTGRDALLCAGATLPAYRSRGCHEALLRARIRLADELACTGIYAWAVARGQSHLNMARVGLRTVLTSLAWRFPPAVAR